MKKAMFDQLKSSMIKHRYSIDQLLSYSALAH